jgi:1-acyl-sn-glycerol-3-phosphate acyltransferase
LLTLNQIKMAIYATYLTNLFGYKLIKANSPSHKKALRFEYSKTLLEKLDLEVKIINQEKIPQDGQFLLASNHKSVIDPLIIEIALKNSNLFGQWIAKKELYNSFFFGLFVRKAGTILLDREKSQMGDFFKDIKSAVKDGDSIFIFPEGTRSKGDIKLGKFKEGSKIIALKNRLDILPVYIKDNATDMLMSSLKGEKIKRVIEIEIGDVISYKGKSASLEDAYKKQFNIN